jgi:hypothetical protein
MLRSRLARTTTAALIGLAAAAASLTAGGVTGELVRPLPQGRLVRPDRARLRPWVSYTGSAAPAYGTAPSWSTGPLEIAGHPGPRASAPRRSGRRGDGAGRSRANRECRAAGTTSADQRPAQRRCPTSRQTHTVPARLSEDAGQLATPCDSRYSASAARITALEVTLRCELIESLVHRNSEPGRHAARSVRPRLPATVRRASSAAL